MNKIKENELAIWECAECKKTHSINDWDKTTIARCSSRESRRHFKSLGELSCRVRKSKRAYICPSCNKVVMGYEIRRVTEK